jgi:gamma-glutamylcyclotransferase (GGCT)/AIG2-like uncharacterized protein YtfP
MYYFAYGSNLWLQQMRERCPDHRSLGMGILRGYRWIISKRGYATIIASQQDEVHGRVYELSWEDVTNLDWYEGVHEGRYRKEFLQIEADGRVYECLVYVDYVEEPGLPHREYVERINRGISDSCLPRDYILTNLRRFVPAMDDE